MSDTTKLGKQLLMVQTTKSSHIHFQAPKNPANHTHHTYIMKHLLFFYSRKSVLILRHLFFMQFLSNNSCVLSAFVKTKVKVGGKERHQNTRGGRRRVGYILQIQIIFCLDIGQMRVKRPSANLKFTAWLQECKSLPPPMLGESRYWTVKRKTQ